VSGRAGGFISARSQVGSRTSALVVAEEDAALLHSIFQLYLELGSLNLLMKALRKRGIRTKSG
jgi:hypothetical protein